MKITLIAMGIVEPSEQEFCHYMHILNFFYTNLVTKVSNYPCVMLNITMIYYIYWALGHREYTYYRENQNDRYQPNNSNSN